MTLAREHLERRVLVLAPTGRDAGLTQAMLEKAGIGCDVCPDPGSLARAIDSGAGAVLVAEEAISNGGLDALGRIVSRQPPWSDLPVLLLTRTGADSPAASKALEVLGNVTLLERPVRIAALASAVRSALRARDRQSQTRSHLLEREEADHRKDEFLAMLAHELRNPLAPLRNAVEIMRHTAGSGSGASHLCDMMERQIAYMVRLVDDLLDVSRITRGRVELRKERVELAAVIGAAVETSRTLIESARHELTVTLPEQALYVEADATRLAQIFANLLNNAAKYTEDGGRITVSAISEGATVTVSVRDTGLGICAADLPRIFDMFVQADATLGRAQGGVGIGLTLVRSLIEMHGGSVEAKSDGVGRGSEFTIRLPLVPATGTGAGTWRQTGAAEVEPLIRVLIVDDNRDAADSLCMLLEILGADVKVAHDGAEALDALKVHRPAVVFLDLGMPGMDGYEVARRIRQHPESHDTTLIALSGWGQDKDRLATEAAGFDHHLVKPAEIDALQELLRSVASHRA